MELANVPRQLSEESSGYVPGSFAPKIVREISDPYDPTFIATALYSAVMRSATSAGTALRRLLKAYGRPSGIGATINAIYVFPQYWLALEMVQISEITTELAAQRLRSVIEGLATRQYDLDLF